MNYDWAETSKTGLEVTLWSAPVAAGRFFGLRGLGRCLPCPGPVCTSCFPDLGLTGPIISKTRALYIYLIWENVGRKGTFFFFWQLQPIKHMVTRSKTHVIRMGKLPYRRIDLVNVSPSGSGKRLPGPAVCYGVRSLGRAWKDTRHTGTFILVK